MGTILLIVVMALWAAVLLPPLLRSRSENRPNSSVTDFRAQLSSLQRVVPGRTAGVRAMGRPLAPAMPRPAATGRPGQPAKQGRQQRAAGRTHGGRQHAERRDTGRRDVRRDPATELKRRRTNVLFALALTAACSGFLAATTGSKAMIFVFALSMVALGGYVYVLASQHQATMAADDQQRFERRPRRVATAPTRSAPADPLLSGRRRSAAAPASRYDDVSLIDDADEFDEFDDFDAPAPRRRPARRPRVARPSAISATDPTLPLDRGGSVDPLLGGAPRSQPATSSESGYRYRAAAPGSGSSGRISYGRATSLRANVADDATRPLPRTSRTKPDPFGRDNLGREITRNTPVINGRHATGQNPVTRRRTSSDATARR